MVERTERAIADQNLMITGGSLLAARWLGTQTLVQLPAQTRSQVNLAVHTVNFVST